MFVKRFYLIKHNHFLLMSVKIESGKWKTVWKPKKASTTFVKDSLLVLDAGFATPAGTDAGAADKPVLGVYQGPAYASSDVTTSLIAVQTPADPYCVVRATVSAGTPSATADLGKSFDMADDVSVTFSVTTNEPVAFEKYISATEGLFVLGHTMSGPSA